MKCRRMQKCREVPPGSLLLMEQEHMSRRYNFCDSYCIHRLCQFIVAQEETDTLDRLIMCHIDVNGGYHIANV